MYDGVAFIRSNLVDCQDSCTYENGCDFIVYYSDTQECHHKWSDKEAYMGMQFRGDMNDLCGVDLY